MVAEALGRGWSLVKSVSFPGVEDGVSDESNDGKLNWAVLGCAGACLSASVSVPLSFFKKIYLFIYLFGCTGS